MHIKAKLFLEGSARWWGLQLVSGKSLGLSLSAAGHRISSSPGANVEVTHLLPGLRCPTPVLDEADASQGSARRRIPEHSEGRGIPDAGAVGTTCARRARPAHQEAGP